MVRCCMICYEDKSDGREVSGASSCHHRFCHPCITRHWSSQIYGGEHWRLSCPHPGCRVKASEDDARAVVFHLDYLRMLYFRARDEHPDAAFCSTDLCWKRLPSGDGIVQCEHCSQTACTRCEQPAGPSHHCTVANKRRLFPAKFWSKAQTKTCPTCSLRLQRTVGFYRMSCPRCEQDFCWGCKGFLFRTGTAVVESRACSCYMRLNIDNGMLTAPFIYTRAVIAKLPRKFYKLLKPSAGLDGEHDEHDITDSTSAFDAKVKYLPDGWVRRFQEPRRRFSEISRWNRTSS